jgi:hypothetical protein
MVDYSSAKIISFKKVALSHFEMRRAHFKKRRRNGGIRK